MWLFLLTFLTLAAVHDSTVAVHESSKPVCHCWTRACNFCQDARCAVKYDLTKGQVFLNSRINRGSYNTLVLYNTAGQELGVLKFRVGRFILSGCVQMMTHSKLHKHVWKGGQSTDWSVSLQRNNVTVRVGEWQQTEKLVGECKEHYSDVMYFAFQPPMECRSAAEGGALFTMSSDMQISREYYMNCVNVCN